VNRRLLARIRPSRRRIKMPEVSIIIPTLNRLDMLEACLDSIERHTGVEHEVIVHANECTDATSEFLAARPDVRAIKATENRFFTQAVNAGIAIARGEYVFLMNDDCHATGPGWTDFYIDLLNHDPEIGVVGPHWHNIDELPYGWIEPYAAMYRRSIFDELGDFPFFDESFCLWWSDIYFAYRLMHAGYQLFALERNLADSVVAHARGIGEYGDTVLAMQQVLDPACFEFHGRDLMYERLGIESDRDLAGFFGDRVWEREEVSELLAEGHGVRAIAAAR
jgi:GT2 family glycosyltransferase